MFGRRILVLVAVLMGLTALAASLAPPPQRLGVPTAPPTPSPTPTPTPGRARSAVPTVQWRLTASGGGRPPLLAVREGDTVALTVSGDVVDTVVIEDLAVSEPLDPDVPAQALLYVESPGRYAVRLVDAGRRIGTLVVTAGR